MTKKIVLRVPTVQHGPIARLIDPSGLGERLKPFIFLDFFHAKIEPGFGFGMHPHSGIATLTWQPGTDVQYEDTTGQKGILKAGGLEWMNAGGGAWHQAQLLGSGRVTGFQLWVPMPPGVESGPSMGQYVPPDQVPVAVLPKTQIKVLLGEISGATALVVSPIESHQSINYLVVDLAEGGGWEYVPPDSHTVSWAFAFEGRPVIQDQSSQQELLVFEGEGEIGLRSPEGPSRILIGSARRHEYALVMGSSSVHTSRQSLMLGEQRIRELRQGLRS